MRIDKFNYANKYELTAFILVYVILFSNAIITHDSVIALISAFCGISYTILAGKGLPICYLIGVIGSAFYSYLAFKNALWGNLLLYAGYYIPMQITGFFHWNKHLKQDKQEIVKITLSVKEKIIITAVGLLASAIAVKALYYFGDNSPYIDGITTIFSIIGMYLTVKRALEQWVVWVFVNGLSLVMWLKIAMSGVKVYSTVIMWAAYFTLAFYFFFLWKKDIADENI